MQPDIFNNDEKGRDEFERLSLKAIEWIKHYYQRIEEWPVRSSVQPGDIYKQFPDRAPAEPVNDKDVFKILDEVILPGITHWQHPNFHAFFPGNTSFPSIIGE